MSKRCITGKNNSATISVVHMDVGSHEERTILEVEETLDGENFRTVITLSRKGRKALRDALQLKPKKGLK
jgi:hypothetical protein